jgi:hypothetical protein
MVVAVIKHVCVLLLLLLLLLLGEAEHARRLHAQLHLKQ